MCASSFAKSPANAAKRLFINEPMERIAVKSIKDAKTLGANGA